MFGIGMSEMLLIFVLALIVLGPKKLPEVARTLGKALGEFRKVSTEFQRTINTEIALEEHDKLRKEAESELFESDGTKKTIPEEKTAANKEAVNLSVDQPLEDVADNQTVTPAEIQQNSDETQQDSAEKQHNVSETVASVPEEKVQQPETVEKAAKLS